MATKKRASVRRGRVNRKPTKILPKGEHRGKISSPWKRGEPTGDSGPETGKDRGTKRLSGGALRHKLSKREQLDCQGGLFPRRGT